MSTVFNSGDFFIIPNKEAINGIDVKAQVVYMWLCSYSDKDGTSYPSIETLCENTSLSKTSVIRAISELENAKLIRKNKRVGKNGQMSNLYEVLVSPPKKKKEQKKNKKSDENVTSESTSDTRGESTRDTLTITNINYNNSIDKSIELVDATKKDSEIKYGNVDINECFDYFKNTLGWEIQSRKAANRRACHVMIKKFGVDGVKKLIDGIELASHDRYAPHISDFEGLQKRYNDLMLWGKKNIASNNGERIVKVE